MSRIQDVAKRYEQVIVALGRTTARVGIAPKGVDDAVEQLRSQGLILDAAYALFVWITQGWNKIVGRESTPTNDDVKRFDRYASAIEVAFDRVEE